jgi:hypothetical protein
LAEPVPGSGGVKKVKKSGKSEKKPPGACNFFQRRYIIKSPLKGFALCLIIRSSQQISDFYCLFFWENPKDSIPAVFRHALQKQRGKPLERQEPGGKISSERGREGLTEPAKVE